MLVYCYTPKYQRAQTGNVPPGWVPVEDPVVTEEWPQIPMTARELYGVIGYRAELSAEQVERFNLTPLGAREVAL